MIDLYAAILANLDRYGKAYPLCWTADEDDFETEMLYAMSKPITDETPLEELNRRYPNWRDEVPHDG